MAYEYKEEIENHIICAPVHVDDEVFDELEEVYAKAKAFDQIKVIHDKHIYDFLNMSETECIEKIGDILEDK
ncbi:hypothetical protein [Mammaliicoccus sciuri]|uniref:hypothetical protein n=1 Tax=Mammaliicoccus sciuri TaxID=1296 RepID=UPI003F57BC9F